MKLHTFTEGKEDDEPVLPRVHRGEAGDLSRCASGLCVDISTKRRNVACFMLRKVDVRVQVP